MVDPAELIARRAEFVRWGIPRTVHSACEERVRALRRRAFAAAFSQLWKFFWRGGLESRAGDDRARPVGNA